MAVSDRPIETDTDTIDDDRVRLRLFEGRTVAYRVELVRERDNEDETWTFDVDDERVAKFVNSSTLTDLAAEPEVPEWVEDLLLASEVERIEK
jgi:hypothetical protein